MRSKLNLVLLVGLSFVLSFVGYGWFAFLNKPMAIPNTGTIVTLEPGESARSLSRQLEGRGFVRRASLFEFLVRVTGTEKDLKAGDYLVAPGTRPRDFLDQLVQGRTILHSVTFIEGWTFRNMLESLSKKKAISHQLALHDPDALVDQLELENFHPEGLFFPDTYLFSRGSRDIDILLQAKGLMLARLEHLWARRRQNLPLDDPYEALILASIIEKETGNPDERAKIAGVFVRRLEKGMRLQADPTVIYGLGGDFTGDLTRAHLENPDNLYNTYKHKGLPPTPIAMPGEESIYAALHPAEGDALYFVARGDGSHVFSSTLAEHNAAVRQYQKVRADQKP